MFYPPHCRGYRLRLRDQGAQCAFAPRERTPFVAFEFSQVFGELGVGFGWHARVADDSVELRCPDLADAQQVKFSFRGLAREFRRRPAVADQGLCQCLDVFAVGRLRPDCDREAMAQGIAAAAQPA